ncbi:N-acetylmuramoyl-L-alanine amidase [Chitinivorax sp. B]|uniref:N-acetylmuramoyl-L-alanine amidase family protein n=1 Tax=Chitinivorax sp. B TaxID=2502235 RepID=UPI0010F957FB|nr:N-acetylmuramoyl-L-alanine amidase [Chitinivorax sp. B]
MNKSIALLGLIISIGANAVSSPELSGYEYNMRGDETVVYLKKEMEKRNCGVEITPRPWDWSYRERPVNYYFGMSAYLTRVQNFDISPIEDSNCAHIFDKILTCGGTCLHTIGNSATRKLQCTEGHLQENLIGTKWMWACSVDEKPVIAIDPGHGLECAAKGMKPGSVGATDFPANDPPPGRLHEDELTMAISKELQSLLNASGKYKAVLTKNNLKSCPSFDKRVARAMDENAKLLVSVHINSNGWIKGQFVPGTYVLFNSAMPMNETWAEILSASVAAKLGTNDRGTEIRKDLALLNISAEKKLAAVLVETARLNGSDEKILHSAGAVNKAALGIKNGIDKMFGR